MKRRDFITLLGGAMATWPLAARAQQAERMRRIGVLMSASEDEQGQVAVAAFIKALQQLGWTVGRNVQIDYRWGAGDPALYRRYAAELIALAPDVALARGGTTVGVLQQATHTVPIVFVEATDPVGRGLVASLARPGGNTTGFAVAEFGLSVKWLELLKQLAPPVTRAAILRDPTTGAGLGQFGAMQGAASVVGVELSAIDLRDAGEIERAVSAFARGSNGGLIVVPNALAGVHRKLIIMLAARHRLPAVYPYRHFAISGGLISYGPDEVHQYSLAAGYVDRILKGEKPADLPVQTPTKLELVINLKTARALGLTVPLTLQALPTR
jgi:putative tryptophan/tyrosine transport system substrate-binding protein